jgi:hypothetical protein
MRKRGSRPRADNGNRQTTATAAAAETTQVDPDPDPDPRRRAAVPAGTPGTASGNRSRAAEPGTGRQPLDRTTGGSRAVLFTATTWDR